MSDYNDRWKALQEKHPDLQKVLDDPAVKKAGEYYEMDQRWQLTVPEELWSKYKVERGQPIPESVMTPYDAARWKSAHDPLNDSRSSTDLTKAIDRATRMLNRTLDDSAKFSESDVVDIGEHLRVEAAIRPKMSTMPSTGKSLVARNRRTDSQSCRRPSGRELRRSSWIRPITLPTATLIT